MSATQNAKSAKSAKNVYNDLPNDVRTIVDDMAPKKDSDRLNDLVGMGINDNFEQFYQTHIYPIMSSKAASGGTYIYIRTFDSIYPAIINHCKYSNFKRLLKKKGIKVSRPWCILFGFDIRLKW